MIHPYNSILVNNRKRLLFWFHFRGLSLVKEGSCGEIDLCSFCEFCCLRDSVQHWKIHRIMMVEDVAGVECIISVGAEHAWVYFVIFDELLNVFEFCNVAKVPGGEIVIEEMEVIAVEERTGIDHSFEQFVLLSIPLVLDGQLFGQYFVGVHRYISLYDVEIYKLI
jgi:hypothetical protein